VTEATAIYAMKAVLAALVDAGVPATDDPGAFFPAPVKALVGIPELQRRGLQTATYRVPVTVVSGDPLTDARKTARLLTMAEDAALVLSCDQYRSTSWGGGANSEPLPAIEMAATVSLSVLGPVPIEMEEEETNAAHGL
jgi:hypothetical protein